MDKQTPPQIEIQYGINRADSDPITSLNVSDPYVRESRVSSNDVRSVDNSLIIFILKIMKILKEILC
jgi:hypothetical protein